MDIAMSLSKSSWYLVVAMVLPIVIGIVINISLYHCYY